MQTVPKAPDVNEIRDCEESIEINRTALIRLLRMAELKRTTNGSDRTAMDKGYDALGIDGICRSIEDLER